MFAALTWIAALTCSWTRQWWWRQGFVHKLDFTCWKEVACPSLFASDDPLWRHADPDCPSSAGNPRSRSTARSFGRSTGRPGTAL